MISDVQFRHLGVALLGTLLLVGATACEEATISEKQAATYVDEWAKQARETLEGQVSVASARDRFEKIAKKHGEADANKTRRKEPPYDAFVREVYNDVGWKLRLVDGDGLTDRGETVWQTISAAEDHAIDVEKFEFDAIRGQLEKVKKFDRQVDSVAAFSPNDAEKQAARDWLVKQKISDFELKPQNYQRLAQAVIDSEAGSRLSKRMKELEDVYVDRADRVARLEQLLARNTARWAREMKHFRIRHVFVHPREDDYWSDPVTEGERPDEALGPRRAGQIWRRAAKIADEMKKPIEIRYRRIKMTLKGVLTEEDPSKVLDGLEPDQPQYARLKKEQIRYRKIVDDGGWEKVPVRHHLDVGDSDEVVAKLKKRLQIEGYYPEDAEIDESYGEKLEKAVETYQKTHQMKVTGEPHRVFWSSLNKSAERRLAQIRLNLKRWRESNVRHSDPNYVLVNIPDFHVELWDDQERQMRFEIVVGNDKTKYDKEKEKKLHPNHTPELSAYIDRVIYNPFWNVTDRIRNNELLPKVRRSLENKYKAKLRSLRLKKRQDRLAKKVAEETGFGQYFASAGSSTSSDSTSTESDTDAVSAGPLAGPSTDESEEESGGSDSEGDGSDEKSESSKETEHKVSIDDLYKMKKYEDESKKVDKYAVFDVAKIRKLIESSKGSSGAGGSDESGGIGTTPTDTVAGTAAAPETGSSEDGETKSAIEKMFPYLDPKTGVVDASSTDPDNIPGWYEENDYEVMHPGQKWEFIRQTQGNHNALGRVKVIFPNMHSVYLHDTPKKALFGRKIRAFSHGCMRMKKPLEFAKAILQKDGKFDQVDVPDLLEGEMEWVKKKDGEGKKKERVYPYKPIFLDKQIPVHVEYFTVRVDDDGRANFFADIYDKDAKALGWTSE